MMIRRIYCITFTFLFWHLGVIASPQHSKAPYVIGPDAVWNPSSKIRDALYSACSDFRMSKPTELVDCVSSFMKKNGASPQAVAFSRLLGGKGFLTSFKEAGRIDIGDVYYFVRGNEPTGLVFLNGNPMVIDVEGPCCDAIEFVDEICDCPENVDKARRGYHPAFTSATHTGSGQRFIIRDENRKCHACDVESHIYNAYDFDAAGKFLRASFLYERSVETNRGQRRMKTN
jgi:hypothetical protein